MRVLLLLAGYFGVIAGFATTVGVFLAHLIGIGPLADALLGICCAVFVEWLDTL